MNQLHVLYFFIGFGLSAAQCTLPIDEDTIVQVVVGIESGEDPADITLNHIWTNCLAAGVEEDTYRFATLTVQYINANSQVRKAIFDFRCKPDESWDRHGTGSTGNVVMDNSTMTGCRECSSSGSDSDDHHCLPCDDKCLVDGVLGLCTDIGGMDCCNYYDLNNICTEECGSNQEPNNATYHCQCTGNWIGPDCAVCGLTCNNGTMDDNCTMCTCSEGFTGPDCLDIDYCYANPCVNGDCINEAQVYTCKCSPGYDGVNCSMNINDCDPNPCENGGMCVDGIDYYTCNCISGFNGINCTENINDCNPNPCENGGTCVDGIDSYACNCISGFNGTNCTENIDDCDPNPCENGGTCVDGIDYYTCNCISGFNGINCTENINNCDPNPCENGGTCVDGIDSYTCNCISGFNSTNCTENINDCNPNPCENGGTCVDGIDYYTCNCISGFNGINCTENINDCNPNPCENGGTCVDGIDSYACNCISGFNGTNCTENINDCDPNPCENGGTCVDEIDSYICNCMSGFNDTNCTENINDCENNQCQYGECVDGIDDYSCECRGSWTGTLCDHCMLPYCEVCSDTDEGQCSACQEPHMMNNGVCDLPCKIECSSHKVDFGANLCQNYCQLQKWVDEAVENGIPLPYDMIEQPAEDLSNAEKWEFARHQWEEYGQAWLVEAEKRGILFTSDGGSGYVEHWSMILEEAINRQVAWEEHAHTIDPSIAQQDYSGLINTDDDTDQDELYDAFASNWAVGFSTYQKKFGNE